MKLEYLDMVIYSTSILDGNLQLNCWCCEMHDWEGSIHKFNLNFWKAIERKPGPRLNIQTVLSTYGDFHVKDKTAVRTSYL